MATGRAPLADDYTPWSDLTASLRAQGIEAVVVSNEADLETAGGDPSPHLALLNMVSMSISDAKRYIQGCARMGLPVIALVPERQAAALDVTLEIDDFVVIPSSPGEIVTRAKRALRRTKAEGDDDVIRIGDLVINPITYEVSLKGRRVNLRFKEYELLKLLATNPGRVYTRESLLSIIWGYDYFGGTRTVDVHIRRLRSKIEDADLPFIETIWNVGYRFRDPGIS